ncbi:MAG: single-stranded DNA-binding protein [Solirubrobacterales bacterium]
MSHANTNRVILIGRLTRDPELRALPTGNSVCSLRVACNGLRKDGESYQERPNFFDVSVFGGQGENVERYLRKGSRLAIDGRLEWREWETTDDRSSEMGPHKRQAVAIIADSVEFLDSPGSAQREGAGAEGELQGPAEERELVGAGVGGEGDLVF